MDGVPLAPACACHPTRRGFLTGLLAGAAAGCAAPGPSVAAQRIDIHHHVFSPAYVAELDKVNQAPPIVKSWSVPRTLDDMAAAGVATAMLSVTTPQVGFASAADARRIAREANEYAARLAQDHR